MKFRKSDLLKRGNDLDDKSNLIITLLLSIGYTCIFFLLVQYLCGGYTGGPAVFFLNLLIIGGVMDLGLAISGNSNFALKFAVIVTAAFAISNHFIMEFRGIPILAPDLTVLKTAANVAGGYEFHPDIKVIVTFLAAVAMVLAVRKVRPFKIRGLKERSLVIALFLVLSISFLTVTIGTDVLSEKGIRPDIMKPVTSQKENGTLLNFLSSFSTMRVKEPEGYSTEKAEDILERYSVRSGSKSGSDIIVIIDEAFADLGSFENIETNKEIIPVYHSIKENAIKGNAYVSTVAGGTANSEFEVLTGCSMAYMPTWTTPFQLYLDKKVPSLAHSLRKNGYEGNFAFHPFDESGYNRVEAYENLGFEDFISIEDIDIEEDQRTREYLSDSADFKMLEEFCEDRRTDKKPVFAYNLTMANHSPYTERSRNVPDVMELEGKYDPDTKEQTEIYLDLANESDIALGELIGYYEKQTEPVTILFMGDHQPLLTEEFYEKALGGGEGLPAEKLMEKFRVPFMIWANHDIEEKYIERISANYLYPLLLKTACVPLAPYEDFMIDAMEEVPAVTAFGYWDSNGRFYAAEDGAFGKDALHVIKEQQILAHYMIFDDKRKYEYF